MAPLSHKEYRCLTRDQNLNMLKIMNEKGHLENYCL